MNEAATPLVHVDPALTSAGWGVDQLDADKLSSLLKLEYGSIDDATARLGPPGEIRKVFIDFRR